MTDTSKYAAAVRDYHAGIAATMRLDDRTLSPEGLQAQQHARVASARASLTAARPALPVASKSADDVLNALTSRTSDEIARRQHEQAKVRQLLDAGRTLDDVIATASQDRAVAIVDMVETLPEVLTSNHGDAITAEVRAGAFARLADLGIEQAVQVRNLEQQTAPARAWHRVMTELTQGSEATTAAWQDVYRADPDGYATAQADVDGQATSWSRRFD